MWKIVFPKSNVSRETIRSSLQLFLRNSCKMSVSDSSFTRRGGLVRPASKSFRFSHHPLRVPKVWHRDFAACGQRSGLLALNLASIFEKLLDQKTFCFCAPHRWSNLFFILQISLIVVLYCFTWNNVLGKPIACGSPVVVLSELVMNLSQISVFLNFFCF